MHKDAGGQKTKKNPLEAKADGLKPKFNKMQKDAGCQKINKNPSEPKPNGLKSKAIKYKRTQEVKKKFHRSLSPTALNQMQ